MYTHEFISSHLKQEGGNKVKARIQVKLLKYIILYSNTWCDNTSKTATPNLATTPLQT